ncbi:MAG: aminotransferase class III-fold pyridoxal phosphate-dependent enzyme, partial [Planctomycetes bacterium]|nr:aminotransferase class III-fold pyridoxal phosphate-dependent enzyme [Planctomycetota bacterium]
LRDEDLAANAAARGRQLLDGLGELCERSTSLREVRGEGLLLGLEFNPLPDSIRQQMKGLGSGEMSAYLIPNLEAMLEGHIALYVMNALVEEYNIYTQTTRSNPRVLRIEPPLTITSDEVDHFLEAITDCCLEADFCNNLVDGLVAKSGLGRHESKPDGGRVDALFQPTG